MVVRDGARARCKMLWVFRVNTYFERVPSENNVFLADRQWVACRNRKLFFDEVYTGDHFCDGVLYLDTRVHFNKEELAIFIQEFKGTGAAVADLDAGIYTALGNFVTKLCRNAWCWAFFHYFLVAALQRAIAVTKVYGVALAVSNYLNFYVAWLS